MQVTARKTNVFQLAATAVLIAVGILIPMVAPRVVIGPASYTLASHVAIFIAMFISPKVAVGVTLGTTIGFFFGGFPLVIVFRAASHIIWAWPGALYLSRIDKFKIPWVRLRIFSFIIAVIHGAGELVAVVLFYFGTGFPEGTGLVWILGFIGLGSVVHSMVDLEIANVVRLVLQTQKPYRELARSDKYIDAVRPHMSGQ
ncbi:MAG: hypothetical protein FWC93_02870 [Defluviitaleaceae bacterium]|nr:hypothetical protein [Defluviitaleaceae bacterium]